MAQRSRAVRYAEPVASEGCSTSSSSMRWSQRASGSASLVEVASSASRHSCARFACRCCAWPACAEGPSRAARTCAALAALPSVRGAAFSLPSSHASINRLPWPCPNGYHRPACCSLNGHLSLHPRLPPNEHLAQILLR